MSRKLAIKGHSTRGKEVIKLLEMMGGIGDNIQGNVDEQFYYIHEDGYIHTSFNNSPNNSFCKFTLEEFLEKYPFKVGDKVLIPEYESEVRICKMRWDPLCVYVEYMVYRNDDPEWYTPEELLNWNDNPNNTSKNMEEKKINQMSLANCDLDEVEIVLGDKFELKIKDGKYYAVRKQYPKTYEECCGILGCKANHVFTNFSYNGLGIEISDYENKIDKLLQNFRKLRYCRDAYWKIAGEQMGLGKPWEPNWTTFEGMPAIFRFRYNIVCDSIKDYHCLLVFPTEEMRNTFYENFKDLIEQCKELL